MNPIFDPSVSLANALADRRSKQSGMENGALILNAAQQEVHRRSIYAASYLKEKLESADVLDSVRVAFNEGVQEHFVEGLCKSAVSALMSDAGYQGNFPTKGSSQLMGVLLQPLTPIDLLYPVRQKAYKKTVSPEEEFTAAVEKISGLAASASEEVIRQLSQPDLPRLLEAYKKMVESSAGSDSYKQACNEIDRVRQEKLDEHNRRVNSRNLISPEEHKIRAFRNRVLTDVLSLSEKVVGLDPSVGSEGERLARDLSVIAPAVQASAPKF